MATLKPKFFSKHLLGAIFFASSVGPLVAQSSGEPANLAVLFTQAEEAFAAKNYLDAAAKLEAIIKGATPNSPMEMLHFNAGLAYLLGEQYEKAEAAFTEAVKVNPKGQYSSRAYLGIGRAIIAENKPEKLERAIEALRIAAADPQFRSEAGLTLGQVYIKAGRQEEALQVFSSLMGSDVRTPQQTNAAVEVVGLLAETNQMDQLVAYLDRLINQSGVRNAISWYANQIIVRGDQLVEAENYDAALAVYRSIPPRRQILDTQNLALADQRKELAALKVRATAEEKGPIEKRSATTERIGELESAIALTEKAMAAIQAKEDLDAALLMRRGRCLYYLNRYEEALVCFQTLRTDHPNASDVQTASYSEIFVYNQLKNTEEMQRLATEFLKNHPNAKNVEQIATLAGDGLARAQKWPEVQKFYQDLETKFPQSKNLDRYSFFQGVALFQQRKFPEAISHLQKLVQKFPTSPLVEDSLYRIAMANFLSNEYKKTLESSADYLKKFPDGRYAGDVRYRLAFINFSDPDPAAADKVIKDLTSFLASNPNDPAAGSMYSLLGDTYSQKKTSKDSKEMASFQNKALEAYVKAVWSRSTEDVVRYALESATSILQAKKDWKALGDLHADVLQRMPNTDIGLISATWVAKMKVREGKGAEAADLLAESLKSTLGDPSNESVEFLIDELVKTLVPPRNKIAEANVDALFTQLDEIMKKAAAGQSNPTTFARTTYARARLAQMLRLTDRSDLYLKGIAMNSEDPSALSPALLAVSGEILLKESQQDQKDNKPDEAKTKLEKAQAMFQRLSDRYKESMFADAGPVGLGRVAMVNKDYETAFRIFDDAITNNAAMSRFNEATLGKLEALTGLGKYEEAEKLALEIVGDRQFRGETAGKAYLVLAQVYRKKAANLAGGDQQEALKKAHAYYQRVYTAYRAFPEVCAEGYWGAYEVATELGETQIATETLEVLKTNSKLQQTARGKQAQAL
jgi:tetratricopeptide (TPR) repeat protein